MVEHILDEGVHLLVPCTENVGIDTPILARLVRTACAAQLGIRSQGCHHVAGHVDLGHNRDVSLGGIFHDVANLIVGVVAAVGRAVLNLRVMSEHGLRALRAHLRQLRIAGHAEAPALIVGDVPVETVHVVKRDEVDIFFDKLHGEEVTGTVEHHATVAEARGSLHAGGRQLHGLGALKNRQRLAQGLDAIEDTGCGLACDGHAFLVNADLVGLGRELGFRREHKADAVLALAFHGGRCQTELRHVLDILREELCVARHVGLPGRVIDAG